MESFESIILSGHNKKNTLKICEAIVADPQRLSELMDLFFSKNLRICQRSSWAIGLLGESHEDLLKPYFSRMLDNLQSPLHSAVIRNTLRTWHFMKEIPEEFEGEVYDLCYDYFTNSNRAIAVRMFSMVILTKISSKYPELSQELIPTLEEFLPHASVGIQARGRIELKKLRKLI